VVQANDRHRIAGWPREPLRQTSLRIRNAWLVLEAIQDAGPTSRVRISAETGLTGTTVHRITADLRRRRLIVNVGTPDSATVGRPPALFRFNAAIGHVIAVDVGNETMRAGLADLDGTMLARRSRPTAAVEGDLLRAIELDVEELQREAGSRRGSLVAIAVGVAAVTAAEGSIVRASIHHMWEGLELGAQLRRAFGCEVVVAQDDHLAALAELETGACVGLREALIVNVGKGLGAAIIAEATVQRGAHSAAGRVGWIVPSDAGPSGPGASTLSELLTADGLIEDYRRLGGRRTVGGAVDVFAADADGDPEATLAIDRFADRLGWLVATGVAFVDPQRVVVGGGISGSFSRLADGIRRRLADTVALPPPVVGSELGADAVVIGAVAAAMRAADEWLLARIQA